MMLLSELLNIPRGITAIIGGGGKTTLMYALAKEIMWRERVIVCTTTQILPPCHVPVVAQADEEALNFWLRERWCVCAGTLLRNGKLGAPEIPMDRLTAMAPYVIAEADGSRGLPFKAHRSGEPVIPGETKLRILVVGVKGLGQPVYRAAHRPALYAQLAGCDEGELITPEIAAAVINRENYHDIVFINQADETEDMKKAKLLAEKLNCPVYAGALEKGGWQCLHL